MPSKEERRAWQQAHGKSWNKRPRESRRKGVDR